MMLQTNSESGQRSGWVRVAVFLVVVMAVVGVMTIKDRGGAQGESASGEQESATAVAQGLPRLVDLGADKCIPCKMMAPILEELKSDLDGQCEIVFIDVWKNPNEGPKYGIKIIPTQVFFAPDGTEMFRHEGFFSREDILGKFAEHGYEFTMDEG